MTDPDTFVWSKYGVTIVEPTTVLGIKIKRFAWCVRSREDPADCSAGTAPTYAKAMAAAKRWLEGREA